MQYLRAQNAQINNKYKIQKAKSPDTANKAQSKKNLKPNPRSPHCLLHTEPPPENTTDNPQASTDHPQQRSPNPGQAQSIAENKMVKHTNTKTRLQPQNCYQENTHAKNVLFHV